MKVSCCTAALLQLVLVCSQVPEKTHCWEYAASCGPTTAARRKRPGTSHPLASQRLFKHAVNVSPLNPATTWNTSFFSCTDDISPQSMGWKKKWWCLICCNAPKTQAVQNTKKKGDVGDSVIFPHQSHIECTSHVCQTRYNRTPSLGFIIYSLLPQTWPKDCLSLSPFLTSFQVRAAPTW